MKKCFSLSVLGLIITNAVMTQEVRHLAVNKPQAIADLKTSDGARLVNAKWYVRPGAVREVNFRKPGPSPTDALALYPTGKSIQSHTISPQIHDADFDNGFREIQPTALEERQGDGLLSVVWYKTEIVLPNKIGDIDVQGTTVVFEIVVDDYSEIWVNGTQAEAFGQSGNGPISGYNTRNRIVLTKNAQPGNRFSIAILGINGPLGNIPANYIWVRTAVIDFYKADVYRSVQNVGKVYTIHKKLEEVISPDTKIEKIADGFQFTEGPVWHPDNYLLFSDPNTNTIYRYDPADGNISIYLSHSGYTGADIGSYPQPGSNGLAIDKEKRLVVCQHGNRRVIRHEKKGPVTVLVDRIEGKRLNSPNDLVLRSDGTLYITDPPYGLPKFYDDERKELPYQGVLMYKDGKAQVVATDLGGPNGLAFSPDEKYLYVTNWDIRDIHNTKTIWRYEVQPDGTLKNGSKFFDMNHTEDDEALDGIKVDREGNLYVSAPGGLWILSSKGELLGKIVTPERPANLAWGDDGKTLYMTAHTSLYKVRVKTGGIFSWQ
jgi:gluconolactonase